ncbi:hypothetical protein [Amycolatopsis sp. H20-H5]|uniref:hypothetical protein n=1 Tax=Amycolatopsis sp. H20-H5 TaxID=3046309 RepID=UPI002DBA52EE|nr:hypothetical protein [Amycolatopsis sp. H20-H5]MEC3982628.1 hypothetical protein [Amycolatopsis sp. H20-H5]
MNAVGEWVLHYSWGNANNFGQTPISLNGNGTFAGGSPGKWRQQDGTLLLSFDTGPAKYGGTVDANVASGAMSTFAGLTGSWYMLKKGVVGATAEAASATPYDVAGNKS